jgi:DNA modification methylase
MGDLISIDDLLSVDDGGRTPDKKSLYQKSNGQYASRDAILAVEREMGENQIRERFGFVPKSILRFDKNREMLESVKDTSKVRGLLRGSEGQGYANNLRYSMYNVDAAKFFLDYYLPPKSKVLDPFMGRFTRALAAHLLDMTYVGFDTCSETVKLNREHLLNHFNLTDLPHEWELNHGDWVSMIPYEGQENVFDGVFTCPPYYSTETYSGEVGDMSHMKETDFDAQIARLFNNLHRLVKPSGKHRPDIHPVVVTVGTFRRGDRGLSDMDYLFQRCAYDAGFILHDKVVTENIPPGAGFTFRRNFGLGFVCKAHETTLVFLKR